MKPLLGTHTLQWWHGGGRKDGLRFCLLLNFGKPRLEIQWMVH
jgi:hypothetical protein